MTHCVSITQLARLRNALVNLRDRVNSGEHIQDGICANVLIAGATAEPNTEKYLTKTVFPAWSKFSGKYYYPVAVSKDPIDDYMLLDKWDPKTEYGQLRRELLQFTIAYVSKDIEQRLQAP